MTDRDHDAFSRDAEWRIALARRLDLAEKDIRELYEHVRGEGSWADHRRQVTDQLTDLKKMLNGVDGRGGLVNELTKVSERLTTRALGIGALPSVVAAAIWLIYMWMNHPIAKVGQ